jgi:hypothetical protein
MVGRRPVTITQGAAPFIDANVKVLGLDLNNLALFFFPDQMYVFQQERYGAIPYADLHVTFGEVFFTDIEGAPADAKLIDYVWLHFGFDMEHFNFNPNRVSML